MCSKNQLECPVDQFCCHFDFDSRFLEIFSISLLLFHAPMTKFETFFEGKWVIVGKTIEQLKHWQKMAIHAILSYPTVPICQIFTQENVYSNGSITILVVRFLETSYCKNREYEKRS